jgi:hypothetical protein
MPDMKSTELSGPEGEPLPYRIERIIVEPPGRDADGKPKPPKSEGAPPRKQAAPDPMAITTSSESQIFGNSEKTKT